MTRLLSICRTAATAAVMTLLTACATSSGTGSAPAARADALEQANTFEQASTFEQDRQAILAMAGDFKVTFDFTETVPFVDGYTPKDQYVTGAEEVVRVIADQGDFISLQHILVVGGDEKFAIKHWRQDWTYEPASVLVFIGGNAWETRPLPAGSTAGKWSQVVYQVDDAPRYGAVAAWSHEDGVSQWTPPREWRPLPRRDATKRDDYHAVAAVNRHAITPEGWVHEQDNSKLILSGEAPQVLVREIGVNTYIRSDDVPADIAETYWAQTADFWASVRADWARLEAEHTRFGLTIQGEPEALYMELLGLAGAIVDGETTTEKAAADAREVIDRFTTTDIGTLHDRIAKADAQAEAKAAD